MVIAKEFDANELPQGERASANPNHQERLVLKGIVIQRPYLK